MTSTHKNRVKGHAETQLANISSLVNNGMDIDKILSELSNSIFSIDKESRYILEILSSLGPSNEYEISKVGNNYNLNRFSVSRRIFGTSTLPSLLELGFITIMNTSKHKTGKEIKKFGLTLKGLMAAIARIKFEQIYMVEDYFDKLRELTSNRLNCIDITILYAKYHLALIMSWCKINKLKLDTNLDVGQYFLEGITNHLLRVGNIIEPDEVDWNYYIQTGMRYFTLKHTLVSIIKKIYLDVTGELFSNSKSKHVLESLKRSYENPTRNFLLRYLIKDWVIHLEMHGIFPERNLEIPLVQYGSDTPMDYALNWMSLSEDADVIYEKIAKSLGLRKSKVMMLSYIKYKEKK